MRRRYCFFFLRRIVLDYVFADFWLFTSQKTYFSHHLFSCNDGFLVNSEIQTDLKSMNIIEYKRRSLSVSYLQSFYCHSISLSVYQPDLSSTHWRKPESLVGASPFSLSLTSPPSCPLLPSPPLRSRPNIVARGSGERLSSPSAAKRFLVHVKHYFSRERIENQI